MVRKSTPLELFSDKGGNRHPASVRDFILDHLKQHGEDYISNMHRAFKKKLRDLAKERGRRPYHTPVYHSFEMSVQILAREGLVEFSGREEVPDSPQFANWPEKPMRRYYRLVGAAPAKTPATRKPRTKKVGG